MSFSPTHDPAVAPSLVLALGLLAGAALGLLYFGALGWTVRCLAAGRANRAALIQAGRFALLAAKLAGLAQIGATALIAGLVGLLLARQVVLRRGDPA